MIVAVAEESRGGEHARQWIEQAGAQYWCLIDTEHRVADLYGMVNVPQAVWIDEVGRIVRPPENAGSTDHFRLMDRTTRTLAAEHQAARLAARTAYLDAVRDWVLTGRHALPADAASSRLPRITPDIALAQAHFRLGVWLRRHGNAGGGRCASGGGQPATSGLCGTCGGRPRTWMRSARQAARLFGSVCRRWGRSRTIRHRRCSAQPLLRSSWKRGEAIPTVLGIASSAQPPTHVATFCGVQTSRPV